MTAKQKQISYWKTSAKDSLASAELLFKHGHYDHCLFFCHLAIEKMLKGLVVRETEKTAPYIHDLDRLAILAGLQSTNKQRDHLKIMTGFNLAGRYSEEKSKFYKISTKPYTKKYLSISKQLFLWLAEQYQKK